MSEDAHSRTTVGTVLKAAGIVVGGYLLSALPMAILMHDVLGLSWSTWETAYYPLVWLSKNNAIVGAVFDYVDASFGW
jgi:hypothetical protein